MMGNKTDRKSISVRWIEKGVDERSNQGGKTFLPGVGEKEMQRQCPFAVKIHKKDDRDKREKRTVLDWMGKHRCREIPLTSH